MSYEHIIGIIGFLIFLMVFARLYNTLIRRKNGIEYALSAIDAYLKKRCDLIPTLIETVKHYMEYEKNLIWELTALRTKVLSSNFTLAERAELDSRIARFMRSIILSAENYPELKTSMNFLQLQAAMNEVEEQISAARRALSASITEYNNAVKSFPTNIMASLMGYKEYEWFKVTDDERRLPDVRGLFRE
ncbi:MAG: LemA family protein [Syntrophorhabdaceae bacterium]|nr:LemA family protein [Syntrophorhabdaceae bacterium]